MCNTPRGRGRPPLGRIVEVRLPEPYLARLQTIQPLTGAKTRAEAIRAAIEHYPVNTAPKTNQPRTASRLHGA